jgi:hypothetical protein
MNNIIHKKTPNFFGDFFILDNKRCKALHRLMPYYFLFR